jgi:hypothetical protein
MASNVGMTADDPVQVDAAHYTVEAETIACASCG